MKFAVAAGILAQTLPVLSDSSSTVGIQNEVEKFKLQQVLRQSRVARDVGAHLGTFHDLKSRLQSKLMLSNGALKNKLTDSEPVLCNPSSNDPDVGVLSCGFGKSCSPSDISPLGGYCTEFSKASSRYPRQNSGKQQEFGLLKNKPFLKSIQDPATPVECDPAADVGILSCMEGQTCVRSHASTLGGVCSTPMSRHLQSGGIFVQLCSPDSVQGDTTECDCGDFDVATGTGSIACVGPTDVCLDCPDACCAETCYDYTQTRTYTGGVIQGAEVCYKFETPHEEEFCLGNIIEFSDGQISIAGCTSEFNGQNCTCDVVPDSLEYVFDCSEVDGPTGSDGSDSLVVGMPIVTECTGCELCPGGHISSFYSSVTIDGVGTYLCGEAAFAAYIMDVLSDVECSTLSAIIADTCCEEGEPPYAPCDICGEEDFGSPQAYVYFGDGTNTTCGAFYGYGFLGLLSDGLCASSASYAASCCGATVPPSETEAPASGPICRFCPNGHVSSYDATVYIPTRGPYSCGQLFYASYFMNYIDEVACPLLTQVVSGDCCADGPAPYDQCDVCSGEGLSNPTGTVTLGDGTSITCSHSYGVGYLGLLNEDDCATYTSLSSHCCGDSPVAPSPVSTPSTPSPVASPTTPTASPVSGTIGVSVMTCVSFASAAAMAFFLAT